MNRRRPREDDDEVCSGRANLTDFIGGSGSTGTSSSTATSLSTQSARPRTEPDGTAVMSTTTSSTSLRPSSDAASPLREDEKVNKWTGKPYSAAYFDMLRARKRLPVYEHKEEILETVRNHPVTLLVGETGSGKTTQVPQFLAELLRSSLSDSPQRPMNDDKDSALRCTTPRNTAEVHRPASGTAGSASTSPLPLSSAAAAVAASSSPHVSSSSSPSSTSTPPNTSSTHSSTVTPTSSLTSSASAVCLNGMVVCTQPRRIAAISVAARVAAEMDVVLGEQVGYHVRFQSLRSPHTTRVLYLTDGMLLREALHDALLSAYSIVIVDEAHERTVDTDVVLGWMKQVVQRRPNRVRLVVMSATLDVSRIRAFFPHAPLLRVSGRMYPVEVCYAPRPVPDVVEAAVACVLQIHERYATMTGDVLCFLTGEGEIERAVAATRLALTHRSEGAREELRRAGRDSAGTRLSDVCGRIHHHSPCNSADLVKDRSGELAACHASSDHVQNSKDEDKDKDDKKHGATVCRALVLPLYGALALHEQQRVFDPCPCDTRKIIFATNIAETSVTIDGVVFVVDGGYQKHKLYSSTQRVDYLLPTVISQASAEQRRGRAGRTRPGQCYRLYTADDFARVFPAQNFAEIRRSNLANTLLLLLKLGVDNPCTFPFIEPPAESSLEEAFYQLLYFGAVDDSLQLTPFGRQLAELPVDVCLARMLLCAARHGCAGEAAVLAAMLEAGGGTVFTRPTARALEADAARARFQHPDGDHLTLIRVFHAYLRSGSRRVTNRTNGASCREGKEEEGDGAALTLGDDTHVLAGPSNCAHAPPFSSARAQALFCRDNFLRPQTLQQAVQIYTQLRRWMTAAGVAVVSTYRAEVDDMNSAAVRRAILEGFFMQVAFHSPADDEPREQRLSEAPYRTVRDGVRAGVHRSSTFGPSAVARAHGRPSSWPTWLVYDRLEVHQLRTGTDTAQGAKAARAGVHGPSSEGSDDDNVALIRIASAVEVDWLLEQSEFYRHPTEIADGEIALRLTQAAQAHK